MEARHFLFANVWGSAASPRCNNEEMRAADLRWAARDRRFRTLHQDRRACLWMMLWISATPASVSPAQSQSVRKVSVPCSFPFLSELVTEDMGAVRFGEVLRRVMNERYRGFTFAKITGDLAGDVRAQTDEVTPFQILRKAGIPAQPAATHDFIKRRESVAGALSRLIDGAPGLIVHPQCVVLRKAMAGGYCLKRVQISGEAKYRDMPDKNDYSHVAESLQYLLVGGGEARLLVQRTQRGARPQLAVME